MQVFTAALGMVALVALITGGRYLIWRAAPDAGFTITMAAFVVLWTVLYWRRLRRERDHTEPQTTP